MKRVICILITAFLIMGFCLPTMAAPTLTSALDMQPDGLVVKGKITESRSNVILRMEIKNEEGNRIYVDQLTVGYDSYNAEKTELRYSFPPVVIHPKYPSGDYTIEVISDNGLTATTINFAFEGAEKQRGALALVKTAIALKSQTKFVDAIGAFPLDIGLNSGLLTDLNTDGKAAFYEIIFEKVYDVPSDVLTDANVEKVAYSVSLFKTDYMAAITIGQFNDAKTDAELEAWLTVYGADFKVDNALTTSVDESKLYKNVTEALKEDEVLAGRVSGAGKILSMGDIQKAIYENALLTILECRHFTESQQVFKDFPSIFGIDTLALSGLNQAKQGEVYAEACGTYSTVMKAGDAFNALVAEKTGKKEPAEPSRPSGNAGYFVPTEEAKEENKQIPPEEAGAFPDVAKTMWANEAISALSEKGIVNGDENGNYNPDKNITRAEYIKLVVMALGADLEAGSSAFADVSEDAWYKPYIDAAYSMGLVTGDALNCVNSNRYITREDMATILCRSIKDEKTASLTFADSDSISEYAKESVAYLSAQGIINGVGDNMFAPCDNTTRAQAAQIIYNFIESLA